MFHRRLSCDCGDGAGVSCFRCGAHAESDEALDTVDCTGPETEHPPYLLADGTYETCAAHPYAGCPAVQENPEIRPGPLDAVMAEYIRSRYQTGIDE